MKDFQIEHILTISDVSKYFIHIPKHIQLPTEFKINVGNEVFDAKIDNRNRLYINKLSWKIKLRVGQTVEIYHKNGKYYFTVK